MKNKMNRQPINDFIDNLESLKDKDFPTHESLAKGLNDAGLPSVIQKLKDDQDYLARLDEKMKKGEEEIRELEREIEEMQNKKNR